MYQDDSLTLHTDLYQINMMQVYFNQGIHNKNAVFEIFFRKEPFANGYAVFAGLLFKAFRTTERCCRHRQLWLR